MNDGLFLVICRNCRFKPSMIFVVYMIFPNFLWIFEEGAQNLPVLLPAFHAGGILLAPLGCEGFQICLGFFQRHRRVDFLQVCHDLLDVLVADIFGRAADLMHDAALQPGLGINRLDGLHHAAQAVGAEQINIHKVTMIGCPKLDAVDYAEKLTQIFKHNDIRSITVTRMTVPCCGGLSYAVKTAIENSGKDIPLHIVTISPDGKIIRYKES